MKNIAQIRFFLIIGLCLMAASGLFLLDPVMNAVKSGPKAAAAAPKPVATPEVVVSGVPTRIVLPALDIDLPVLAGYYNQSNQTWTLSETSAHYATVTPPLNNQGGNTFIYGHNLPKVFRKLKNVKAGDTMIVYSENKKFYYRFSSAYETTPYDAALFEYKGAPIVTLQTCSGLWFQNRQLFTFEFVRVE